MMSKDLLSTNSTATEVPAEEGVISLQPSVKWWRVLIFQLLILVSAVAAVPAGLMIYDYSLLLFAKETQVQPDLGFSRLGGKLEKDLTDSRSSNHEWGSVNIYDPFADRGLSGKTITETAVSAGPATPKPSVTAAVNAPDLTKINQAVTARNDTNFAKNAATGGAPQNSANANSSAANESASALSKPDYGTLARLTDREQQILNGAGEIGAEQSLYSVHEILPLGIVGDQSCLIQNARTCEIMFLFPATGNTFTATAETLFFDGRLSAVSAQGVILETADGQTRLPLTWVVEAPAPVKPTFDSNRLKRIENQSGRAASSPPPPPVNNPLPQ